MAVEGTALHVYYVLRQQQALAKAVARAWKTLAGSRRKWGRSTATLCYGKKVESRKVQTLSYNLVKVC